MDGLVDARAGNIAKGDRNVVTPVTTNIARQTEVSNNACHIGNHIQLPHKQRLPGPLENNTSVLYIPDKVHNDQVVGSQHSLPQVIDEASKHESADNHLMLLFDINNACDTDKLLSTVNSRRGRTYRDGDRATNCSVYSQWEKQSQFDFGFIPLSNFITPHSQAVNNGGYSPFEAHKTIKESGIPNFIKC